MILLLVKVLIIKWGLADFRGNKLEAVTKQLESLKLKVGNITEVNDNNSANGTILGQNPAPGTEVDENSNIDFTIAKTSQQKTAMNYLLIPFRKVQSNKLYKLL